MYLPTHPRVLSRTLLLFSRSLSAQSVGEAERYHSEQRSSAVPKERISNKQGRRKDKWISKQATDKHTTERIRLSERQLLPAYKAPCTENITTRLETQLEKHYHEHKQEFKHLHKSKHKNKINTNISIVIDIQQQSSKDLQIWTSRTTTSLHRRQSLLLRTLQRPIRKNYSMHTYMTFY